MLPDQSAPAPLPGAGDALRALAVAAGQPVSAEHNTPLWVDDPARVWFVESGTVHVFLTGRSGSTPSRALEHIVEAGAGRLVFGMQVGGDTPSAAVLKGVPGTVLRNLPLQLLYRVPDAGDEPEPSTPPVADDEGHAAKQDPRRAAEIVTSEVLRQVDLWVMEFAGSIVRNMAALPDIRQRVGTDCFLSAGYVAADSGVRWLADEERQGLFLDLAKVPPAGTGLLPMTTSAWVRTEAAGAAAVQTSAQVAGTIGLDRLLDTLLPEFHAVAANAHELNRRMLQADTFNQRSSSSAWRRRDAREARAHLYASVRHGQTPPPRQHPLVEALRAVARHEGIRIRVPEAWNDEHGPPALQDLFYASGIRSRRVRLDPGDGWWSGDSGALLAFDGDDRRPVALLPGRSGRYRVYDPATGKTLRLGAGDAGRMANDAWQLYQPLADDPSAGTGLKGLLDVACSGLARDFARLGGTGLLSGLLNLLPALAIGALVERVIPGGTAGPLVHLIALLAGVACIAALAHVLRGTAVMRLEARAAARVTAALMDRALRFRIGALRRFTTGELGLRVASFHSLRDRIAGAAVSSLLSVAFLLPSLAVVFVYSVNLGWVVVGLGAAALILIAALAAAQVGPHCRQFEASRRVGSDLLQFITGIGKLRAAGAESVTISSWARLFSREKRLDAKVAALGEHIAAISASMPTIAAALIVFVYLIARPGGLAESDFLVILAASMMFFNAIAVLGAGFESIATLAPTAEAVRPIIAAALERPRPVRRDIRLRGELVFDRVSFRYDPDGSDVLTDVSIQAAPGDFVAIVGESGSGKSTLVRLALGLEEPTSGGVYYDGQDLALLDPVAVRRKIGVVTQGAELQPVSILRTIIGETEGLTLDDAWRAARLARLDADIAAMPMGMHTSIAENGTVLSGGQRQRLALAAALVREPPIVILDEATSWLDTVTQENVMANIAAVAVTRIVVAHRLSTTRGASRIYVLQAGRVVQEGTFGELSATEGAFRELMRRQMA